MGEHDDPVAPTAVPFPAYPHEVLAVVLSVRAEQLSVLLWQRTQPPEEDRWALPGGGVRATERLRDAITSHLAAKVDVPSIAWLEQVATHSRIDRDPRARVLATGYLALVPVDVTPVLPADTRWFAVDDVPATAFDHHFFIEVAVERLRAKLGYTNIGFGLAPREFTVDTLRSIVSAALGYQVSATNLNRVMMRRRILEPTGAATASSRRGGRPAALFRFTAQTLTVTDPLAVLRPPREGAGRKGTTIR
ncbi:NUDIX domain-containing protein [uncultured Friedmanniella sp.]|uniref:NUDIX hydrolase n=1 Tax=uncultured Friedmanniella sp. TaxID=335381 RepID=UPI0035CB088A